MNITEKWLQDKSACGSGIKWFKDKKVKDIAGDKLVELLMKDDKLQWANWLIVRIMDYKQQVQYAVFAAEQVIHIFEKKYPNDKRPRQAIAAAKKCIDNPSKENKAAAYAAAYAYAAAADAYAAAAADAYAAAAYSAAYAAYAAAAYSAYSAADAAAYAYAAYAAAGTLKIKILEYGLKLLNQPKTL